MADWQVEAAEDHVLRSAPAHIQAAIRQGEADLVGGNVSVEGSAFADEEDSPGISPEELDLPETGRLSSETPTGSPCMCCRSTGEDSSTMWRPA